MRFSAAEVRLRFGRCPCVSHEGGLEVEPNPLRSEQVGNGASAALAAKATAGYLEVFQAGRRPLVRWEATLYGLVPALFTGSLRGQFSDLDLAVPFGHVVDHPGRNSAFFLHGSAFPVYLVFSKISVIIKYD